MTHQQRERKYLLIGFIFSWCMWLFGVWVFHQIDAQNIPVGQWLLETTVMAVISTLVTPGWSKLKRLFKRKATPGEKNAEYKN
jgi:hypothetical protein